MPNEIRSAAAEMVTAKARGQAKLEIARAETAALRAADGQQQRGSDK